MRILLALMILVAASVSVVPTAHACHTRTATTVADTVYTFSVRGTSTHQFELNGEKYGIWIDICVWHGQRTFTYVESNDVPGLQTSAHEGCAADTLVEEHFLGVTGTCRI